MGGGREGEGGGREGEGEGGREGGRGREYWLDSDSLISTVTSIQQ